MEISALRKRVQTKNKEGTELSSEKSTGGAQAEKKPPERQKDAPRKQREVKRACCPCHQARRVHEGNSQGCVVM